MIGRQRKMSMQFDVDTRIDLRSGRLTGNVQQSEKRLSELANVFKDEAARLSMPQDTLVYSVQMHRAEKDGKEGGLFFGTSFLYPGRVGTEYFMTRGHFHAKIDAAEYYWCIDGEGMLLLMDEDQNCSMERMSPGSLHYIKGRVAHRIANTGDRILAVGACWPSDAGHDYRTIAEKGFSARLFCVDGVPALVQEDDRERQ